MQARLTSIALLVLLSSCTRKEPAHQVESASPGASTRAAEDAKRPSSDAASVGSDKSPLPLVLQIEKSAGGVGLHVLQQGPEPISLAGAVSIERVGGERVEQALTLRSACKQQGCIMLAAGGELLAPPWLGLMEGERCDALFMPKRTGEHLLTVKSCDGTRRAELRFIWNEP